MHYLNRSMILIGVIGSIILSGCVSTTLEDQNEKYKNLSLRDVINHKPLGADEKSAVKQALIGSALGTEADNHMANERRARLYQEMAGEDKDAQLLMAESLLGQKKYSQAEHIFTKIMSTNPSPQALQGLGLSQMSLGYQTEAAQSLNAAVSWDPSLWRSWNGLGIIAMRGDRWDEGAEHFSKALENSADKGLIYKNIGQSYMKQAKYEKAVSAFNSARTLDGDASKLIANHRFALAMSGRMGPALSNATDRETAILYAALGVEFVNNGDTVQGIQYLKHAVSVNPSYDPDIAKKLEQAVTASP